MSSSSSLHPHSHTDIESIENAAEIECSTSTTTVDPAAITVTDSGRKNAIDFIENGHSCSRCSSINSTKSAIVTMHRDNSANEKESNYAILSKSCAGDSDGRCYLTETTSRRSSCSHLVRDAISSYGSYTSLSCRSSTPVASDGDVQRPNHRGHHHRRHQHNHYHHHQQQKSQIYYQTHHALCKMVTGLSQQSDTATPIARKHCRHRRKSSCSTTFGDSFRRRRRMDTESSSFHGSETSVYEPLHVDVNNADANTVILTPSKITIEYSNGQDTGCEATTSGGTLSRNDYTPSPIQWDFLTDREETERAQTVNNNVRSDLIEVLSLSDEFNSSYCNNNLSKPDSCRQPNKKETSQKAHKYDVSSSYSTWRSATDNNEETTNTIIFHHESEVVENCCDNYFYCNTSKNNSETDIDLCGADPTETATNKSETSNGLDIGICNCKSINFSSKCCCATAPPNQMKSLNNSTPSTGSLNQLLATPLINFQKNNIASETQRCLDLSPDIRRYSKISNLREQNATNLMPNYFNRSRTNVNQEISPNPQEHLNQNLESFHSTDNKFTNTQRSTTTATTTQVTSPRLPVQSTRNQQLLRNASNAGSTSRDFELFNISTSSLFEKPFGSINLTTQNQFEPYSNRHQINNSRSVDQIDDSNSSTANVQGEHSAYQQNVETNDTNTTASYGNVDSENNVLNRINSVASSNEPLTDSQQTNQCELDSRRPTLNNVLRTIRKRARKYAKYFTDKY